MSERFCDPHLVKSRLARAFVSCALPKQILDELGDMGVTCYMLGSTPNMSGELSKHPDILLNNYRKGMWLCESNARYLPVELRPSFFTESETELNDLYPFDCPFNNFRLKNALYCGKSADYIIKSFAAYDGLRTVFFPQNYAKCCCVIVNDHAVITSDIFISQTMAKNDFDVLLIKDSNEINLTGYSHGLIGGCGVKISDTLLGFTGDLNIFPEGDNIRDFCANHGVDAFSLTNEPMYDYGGILPITEYIPKSEQDITPDCNFERFVLPESEQRKYANGMLDDAPHPANDVYTKSKKKEQLKDYKPELFDKLP